jgi:aryl-alcohol dehydrogenase-like predicted oxidoreductase
MKQIPLPNTNLKPSVICLGTADLGGKIEREDAFTILDTFIEQGGNFLDTANVYANWLPIERSSSEKTLGRWLKARGHRDQIIIGTKGAHPELSTMQISRLSDDDIRHDVNDSLNNLQTDYIDLYWLHRDDPRRPVGDIIELLNEQVKAGKIRYFGCSNWRVDRIAAAQNYAAEQGLQGFVADQMLWNLAVPDFEAMSDKTVVLMDPSLRQHHQQTGLAAIPYTSQANGLFNKWAAGQPIRANSQRVYHLPENQARLQRVKKLAAETGLTITQIVLGYLISQPFTTIPIVGCQTIEQLRDSLSAADTQLTASQLAYLEQGST